MRSYSLKKSRKCPFFRCFIHSVAISRVKILGSSQKRILTSSSSTPGSLFYLLCFLLCFLRCRRILLCRRIPWICLRILWISIRILSHIPLQHESYHRRYRPPIFLRHIFYYFIKFLFQCYREFFIWHEHLSFRC